MPDLTLDDVHKLLGQRDIQIYQLSQAVELLQKQIATLTPKPDSPPPPPPADLPPVH